ncbi:hypothetical protein AgCh_013432 [Apium graveolens]
MRLERLKMAIEGPCLDKKFAEFLEFLRVSLNFNHFVYKKAVDKNMNFLRVVLVTRQNFRKKRVGSLVASDSLGVLKLYPRIKPIYSEAEILTDSVQEVITRPRLGQIQDLTATVMTRNMSQVTIRGFATMEQDA